MTNTEIADDKKIYVPTYINAPSHILWYVKVLVVVGGYSVLIYNLIPILVGES